MERVSDDLPEKNKKGEEEEGVAEIKPKTFVRRIRDFLGELVSEIGNPNLPPVSWGGW